MKRTAMFANDAWCVARTLLVCRFPKNPSSPRYVRSRTRVKDVVGGMEGVGTVEVQITLSPPWTPDRMTEDARDELGLF